MSGPSLKTLATPTRLAQQGRLLSGDGEPLAGTHALVFTLNGV